MGHDQINGKSASI